MERIHTRSVQKTFATGARLKQPLYACIGQQFGWEIYFPLLRELKSFRPTPFLGARVAPQHTGE